MNPSLPPDFGPEKFLAYEDFLIQLEMMAVVKGWAIVSFQEGSRISRFKGNAFYELISRASAQVGVDVLPPDDGQSCWRYLRCLPMPLIRHLFNEFNPPAPSRQAPAST